MIGATARLARALWIVLAVMITSAFSAGVAITTNANRISNIEAYGSRGLQDHEKQQQTDTLAQTAAMAELRTTVHDLAEQVKGLALEVRQMRQGK